MKDPLLNNLQKSYDDMSHLADEAVKELHKCIETANHNGRAVELWRGIAILLGVMILILTGIIINLTW